MNIHKDFEGFLQFLNEEQVEFVIVGGYAVAFYFMIYFLKIEKKIAIIRRSI